MAWFRKPKYTKIDPPKKKDRIPQDLMTKCESCMDLILQEDFERNLWVCPKCDYHAKISAWQRIKITFDEGTFVEDNQGVKPTDPLEFFDTKSYAERLASYQASSGLNDACVTGVGEIHGFKVSAAVMDITFAGGSMGSVVGEKVTRAMERGLAEKKPVIVIACGGGARMQEGILSLMQMAKTSAAAARLGKARIPFITVLTNPTTGGTMASFASLGDLIIAEPQALIGFAGPRVIEQTIKEILPKGFQRSEFVQEKGFIDIVAPRKEIRGILTDALAFLSGQPNAKYPGGLRGEVIDAKEVI